MKSDMENREWLNDFKTLKQVNTNNPFTVPDGYFNELNERIMAGIKLDEIKNTITSDSFTVPENYFEGLANNIQARIAVENILNAENTGLTVPENYFEELSNNIQNRIAVETVLNTEATGFTVPANYFEDFTSQVQSRLLVEQALNNAEDTLTVPQNYFSELNQNILAKTVKQPAIKRKGAVIRMFSSTAFKYATAACILLTVGTGIFLKQDNSPQAVHNRSFLHQQLATVPVAAIQSYLDENVDANDIQHTVADENLPINTADLKAALQDYSDNN